MEENPAEQRNFVSLSSHASSHRYDVRLADGAAQMVPSVWIVAAHCRKRFCKANRLMLLRDRLAEDDAMKIVTSVVKVGMQHDGC